MLAITISNQLVRTHSVSSELHAQLAAAQMQYGSSDAGITQQLNSHTHTTHALHKMAYIGNTQRTRLFTSHLFMLHTMAI